MANEFQIKNGLILGGINSQTTTYGLSFDPSTGRVGFMSTSSFGSGSVTTGTSGAGTAGYITKWNTGTSLNNSSIYEDISNNIGIGSISPSAKLYVAGTATITGNVVLSSALTVSGTTKLTGLSLAAGLANNVLLINTSTGQLYFTASSAVGGTALDTSQFITNTQTGSFLLNTQTGSFLLNTQTGSFLLNTQTSSFITNSQTSSFAVTASNIFTGNQSISASLNVSASVFFRNLSTTASSNILTIDTTTGQVYYTASSAIGGGGGSGVTISNNTNDYILTATGTANSLNGEANLTFNGTDLRLNGNLIVSGNTTIGDDTTDSITMNAATMSLFGNLNIDSNTLFVDGTNNRIGIGTNNPSRSLHVSGTLYVINTATASTIFPPDNTTTYIKYAASADAITDSTNYAPILALHNAYNPNSSARYNMISFQHGTANATTEPVGIARIGTKKTAGANGDPGSNYRGDFFIQLRDGTTLNEVLYISSSTNVGISTITPAFRLDVSGSGRFTNGLSVTGSLNTSGSVFFRNLSTTASSNILTINTTTGQVYYTASSAIGGGGGTITQVTAGSGLTGGGSSGNVTLNVIGSTGRIVANADSIDLDTTGVSAGIYGTANITVDAYGRITAASNGNALTGLSQGDGITITGTAPTPTVTNTFGNHQHQLDLLLWLQNGTPSYVELLNTAGWTYTLTNPRAGAFALDFGSNVMPTNKTLVQFSVGTKPGSYGNYAGGAGNAVSCWFEFDIAKPQQTLNLYTFDVTAGSFQDDMVETASLIIRTWKP